MLIRLVSTLLIAMLFSYPAFSSSDTHDGTAPQPKQLRQLQTSLAALSSALNRIGEGSQREGYSRPILQKAANLQQSAQTMIQQQQRHRAYQKLRLAMEVVKTAIATLRNQQTLIRSLDFTSPQDEYIYERKRYQGYIKLVDLLINHNANQAAVQLRLQATVITRTAAHQASQHRFHQALETQEQSNRLMVNAIHHYGIPIQG